MPGSTLTNVVEPTGEAPEHVEIATNPPEPPAPTSTLYVEGQPSPTPLAALTCAYRNESALEFETFEEWRAQLHVCNGEFTWPVGYEIDPEKIAFQPGNDMVTGGEVGGGRLAIGLINACGWMTYWVDVTKLGDLGAADETLQYMLSIYPTWNNVDPTSTSANELNDYWKDILNRATLGDPNGIVQYLSYDNCKPYESFRVNP